MTSTIERAIDSLSDPDVSLPDALRRLLVVARRIDAEDFSTWVRSELDGYPQDAPVPEYRDGGELEIAVRFDGYAGSYVTRRMSPRELPKQLGDGMPSLKFRQPVAELEALASGDQDAHIQLPIGWLALYRNLANAGKAPSMSMMTANQATVAIPNTYLRGVLDRIKSIALDFALGIEDASPEAGDAGGPTVETDPALGQTVHNHITNVYATNSNVAVASGAGSTAVQVNEGDVAGLLEAARSLLADDAVADLAEALRLDGNQPAEETRSFLDRVKSGSYQLAAGVTGNAAYAALVELLGMAYPGFP